jgi:hypothetical protein
MIGSLAEILGFGSLVAGVVYRFGAGWGLIVGGAGLIVGAALAGGRPPETQRPEG